MKRGIKVFGLILISFVFLSCVLVSAAKWEDMSLEQRQALVTSKAKQAGLTLESVKGLALEGISLSGDRLITNDGAYLDFNDIPKWIKKVEYKDNKLHLEIANQGANAKRRTIILGAGTIQKSGRFYLEGVTKDPVPLINLGYGEGGIIEVSNKGDFFIREGADLRIGDNFYKQFYTRNSKYKDYRPTDKNGNVIDQEAVVQLASFGDSPSNFRFFPRAKNAIVTIVKDGKFKGEIYTSRVEPVAIIHNPHDYTVNKEGFELNAFPKEKIGGPHVIIKTDGDFIDVDINSDKYVGFVAQKNANIGRLWMKGTGGFAKDGRGKFLYVRNGDFGITVNGDKISYSGRIKSADVSVTSLRNKAKEYNYEIDKREDGASLFAYRKGGDKFPIVTQNSKIWERTSNLDKIAKQVEGFRESRQEGRITPVKETEVKTETKVETPSIKEPDTAPSREDLYPASYPKEWLPY